MVFKNGQTNIQGAGYNGACMADKVWSIQKFNIILENKVQ